MVKYIQFCSCIKCSLCSCVFTFSHLYCSTQLSMSNMEKHYRNKKFNINLFIGDHADFEFVQR